jgi:hypothetical protein
LGPQLVNKRQGKAAAQLLHVEAALASPTQGQQLVPSMAMGSLATMFIMGGRFEGGGGDGRIAMFTTADVVEAPPSSVAIAVKA